MEEKYYVPELSEFHIGFEYEYRWNSRIEWDKTSISKADFCQSPYSTEGTNEFDDILSMLAKGNVRVKYLDEEDIVDCGWETYNSKDYYSLVDRYGLQVKEANYYFIARIGDSEDIGEGEVIFNGIIKNKSELLLVMKMLGINAN